LFSLKNVEISFFEICFRRNKKAVAARMKKDEKKGFSVEELLESQKREDTTETPGLFVCEC
jgi:hypothetical protein